MWPLNDSVVLISVDLDGQFFRLGIQGPILEFSVFNSSDHQFLNLVFFGGVDSDLWPFGLSISGFGYLRLFEIWFLVIRFLDLDFQLWI